MLLQYIAEEVECVTPFASSASLNAVTIEGITANGWKVSRSTNLLCLYQAFSTCSSIVNQCHAIRSQGSFASWATRQIRAIRMRHK